METSELIERTINLQYFWSTNELAISRFEHSLHEKLRIYVFKIYLSLPAYPRTLGLLEDPWPNLHTGDCNEIWTL